MTENYRQVLKSHSQKKRVGGTKIKKKVRYHPALKEAPEMDMIGIFARHQYIQ